MSTPAAWVHGLATDLRIAIAFSTRLPVAQSVPIGGDDVARASWALPIAGLLVGGLGALAYWIAFRIGLPPSLAARAGAGGDAARDRLPARGRARGYRRWLRRRQDPRAQARDHARQPYRHIRRLRPGHVAAAEMERAHDHRGPAVRRHGAACRSRIGARDFAGAHALRSAGANRRPVGSGRATGAAKHRRGRRAGRDRARARPRSARGDHRPHPAGVRAACSWRG